MVLWIGLPEAMEVLTRTQARCSFLERSACQRFGFEDCREVFIAVKIRAVRRL
jgi:hypothetical protein